MLCPLAERSLSGGPQDTKSPCHLISDTVEQLYLTSVYAGGDWWYNYAWLRVCVRSCRFANDSKSIAKGPGATPFHQSAAAKPAPDHTNMSFSLLTFPCRPLTAGLFPVFTAS